jgi:hypothetical protein
MSNYKSFSTIQNDSKLLRTAVFRFGILIIASLLFFSFCNKTTLTFTKDNVETPNYESRTESYLMGYYEFHAVEEWICPSDSHNKVIIERGKIDTAIHYLAGGILTTRSNIVYCSKSLEVAEVEPESKPKNKPKPRN